MLRKISLLKKFLKFTNKAVTRFTRSSHPEVFVKRKEVLKNFAKFTEKHLYWTSATVDVLQKKMLLKISQISEEKNRVGVSL